MQMLLSRLPGLRRFARPDPEWTGAHALFFLSTGRTGTTSLTRLLENCPAAHAVHEPQPQLFGERKRAYLGDDPGDEWIAEKFRDARAVQIGKARKAGLLYAETSAFLSFFTPTIHEIMPNARFVFSHRHPGEFVRSGVRRNWYVSHPNDATRLTPRPGTAAAEAWEDWGQFEKICWLWAAFNEECLRCYGLLDPGRRMTVPSQQLWDNPVDVSERIFRFVALEPPSPEAIRATYEVRHNSQTRGDFDHFEDWPEDQKATLYRIAGPVMRKLGYTVPEAEGAHGA
jgi:hypothetical protein